MNILKRFAKRLCFNFKLNLLLLLFKLIYIHGGLSVSWFSKSRVTIKIQYIIKLSNKNIYVYIDVQN
jgi:hypothetical protein